MKQLLFLAVTLLAVNSFGAIRGHIKPDGVRSHQEDVIRRSKDVRAALQGKVVSVELERKLATNFGSIYQVNSENCTARVKIESHFKIGGQSEGHSIKIKDIDCN